MSGLDLARPYSQPSMGKIPVPRCPTSAAGGELVEAE